MALNLPPVPAPRPGDPAVTAALAVGVRLDDPFPQLYRDDRAADEEIRQIVASLHDGLLTLDQALAALQLTGGGSAAQGVSAQQLQDAVAGRITTQQLADAVLGVVKVDPSTQRLAADVMPQAVTDAVADRITLVDNKLPLSIIPDGIGGVPAEDSIAPEQLAPALRAQIANPAVADKTVTLPKLGTTVAGRVESPRFRPLDQTTALPLPTVYVRSTSPEIPAADVGLASIYDPYLVRVPDAVFAAYPQYGRWRLYTSTDHDATAGGIACMKTDAERPGDPGVMWTSIRPSGNAIIFKKNSGDQIETPAVIWNPVTAKFHMYYQVQGAKIGTITPQYTEVATSLNGITGWTIIVGGGIPTPRQGWLGWTHTGYFSCWLVDGTWVAWHLTSGGTNGSSLGWSYSADGLNWTMDRRRMVTAGSWGGALGKLGISSLFRFRSDLWAAGRVRSSAPGGGETITSLVFMNPMRDDLLGPKGRLQAVPFAVDDGVPVPGGFGLSVAASADGTLWSAYRTGDKNSSFRFMEVN